MDAKKTALLYGSQEECMIWAYMLHKAHPNLVVTFAKTESEANDALYDQFMSGDEFDLVVTNERSHWFYHRKDIQDRLVIMFNGELEVKIRDEQLNTHGNTNEVIKTLYQTLQ